MSVVCVCVGVSSLLIKGVEERGHVLLESGISGFLTLDQSAH